MKILIGFCIVLILVLIGFMYIQPHLWFKGNREAISFLGESLPGAEIYRSPNGETLFRYAKPNSYEDYIIRRESKEVGIPNSDFIPFFVCIYSKELNPPVVLSTNRVKIERDIAVDFQNDYVEFTTSDTKRIRIDFTKLSN